MSPYNEADERLRRLVKLWEQLKRTPRQSPDYEALSKRIRTESDGYNALVDAYAKPAKPDESSDE